jgi:hypothetical protein
VTSTVVSETTSNGGKWKKEAPMEGARRLEVAAAVPGREIVVVAGRPRRPRRVARAASWAEKAALLEVTASGGESVGPGRLCVVAELETTALSRIAPRMVRWRSAPEGAGPMPMPLSWTAEIGGVGAAALARGGL